MDEAELNKDTIYRVIHGSRAYGTHRPDSDRDEQGVAILSDPRYYYGSLKFEQKDKGWSDGVDRKIFDLRKFISLAVRCNPNIIEILYVDKSDILQIDEFGQRLLANRDIFLSRLAAESFVGYAISQLKRIHRHYEWLQNPPVKPDEKDFWKDRIITRFSDPIKIELESHKFQVIPNAEAHGTLSLSEMDANPVSLEYLAKVRHFDGKSYDAAKKRYKNYNKWVRERNPDRAAIEAEYGYDCKHAGHLVRLLRMGKEIIGEGKVQVRRPDAEELRDIRNGKFKYDELIEYAEQLREEVNALVDTSPLPPQPDFKAADALLMDLIQQRLNSDG